MLNFGDEKKIIINCKFVDMQKDIYFGMSSRIARWKLNTPFEKWLSQKADTSSFWKRIYLYYYCIFDHKYYVGGRKWLKKQFPTI